MSFAQKYEEAVLITEKWPDETIHGQILKIRRNFSDLSSCLISVVPDTPERTRALTQLHEASKLCEQACFEQLRRSIP